MTGVAFDPTSAIVAGTGVLAALFGHRQWRQGRKDQQEQQKAANKLQRDQLQLEEYTRLIPDLRIEADRARDQRDEARKSEDRERGRRVEAETALRLAQDEAQRRERRLLSDLHALRLVVQDEITRAATDTAYPELPEE